MAQFYVPSKKILVISGRRECYNEKLFAITSILVERHPPPAGLTPGITRSADQRLTY